MQKKDNKRYVVVGLGKTGLSCVRYLLKKGCSVAGTDDRAIPPALHELRTAYPQVPVSVGAFSDSLLSQADVLVMSPGVPLAHPKIQAQIARGVEITGDVELFASEANTPMVVVTGSNGKSTVVTLVGEMAREAGLDVRVGGNLGEPTLNLLTDQPADLYVLELSSFQLETTRSLKATVGTLLNVSPDHLDRYTSFDHYVSVKQSIYDLCDIAVFNREDARSTQNLLFDARAVSFGLDQPSDGQFGMLKKDGELFFAKGDAPLLSVNAVKLKGAHQWANILASFALGDAVGLPMSGMIAGAKNFAGLPHRCQWIGQFNGVDWYNDSKATNVGSVEAAIEGLGRVMKGGLVLIAGGISKQADFSGLKQYVADYVKTVVLFGRDANQLADALNGATKIVHAKDLKTSIAIADQESCAGDIVILSPACASFDMFEGFDKRGEAFMALVNAFYG